MPYLRRKEYNRLMDELKAYKYFGFRARIRQDAEMVHWTEVADAAAENEFIMSASYRDEPGLIIVDSNYRVVSKGMMDEIVEFTMIDDLDWKEDVQDCDDIALLFVARCVRLGLNSVGRVLAFSGGHAFNVILARDEDEELKFYFFEPQLDGWLKPSNMDGIYDVTNSLMVI